MGISNSYFYSFFFIFIFILKLVATKYREMFELQESIENSQNSKEFLQNFELIEINEYEYINVKFITTYS